MYLCSTQFIFVSAYQHLRIDSIMQSLRHLVEAARARFKLMSSWVLGKHANHCATQPHLYQLLLCFLKADVFIHQLQLLIVRQWHLMIKLHEIYEGKSVGRINVLLYYWE